MNRKKLLNTAKTAVLLILLALLVFQAQKEIKSIDFAKTVTLLRGFPTYIVLLFFIFGMAGTALLTLYDFVIVKYLKLNISPLDIFSVSFLASTLNNISGLGGLTGASVRAVFFKKSTDSESKMISYGLLLVPATGIGLSVMALIALVNYKYIAPVIQKNRWLLVILLGFLVYLILYFLIDKLYYWMKRQPNTVSFMELLRVRSELLLISFAEWFAAYLLFMFIVRQFNGDLDPYIILGVYTLASAAGVASLLPGGAGSFDLVMLLGFQYYGVTVENSLAALILFRVFYYFIPLAIGIVFSLLLQLKSERSPMKLTEMKKVWSFIDKTSNITNFLLRLLIFLSGIVLLVSAMIPGIAERLKIASRLLSFSIMQWSHQLSICIGILLIIISIEIGMKVKRAYTLTFYLLIMGAVFTFLKGFDYEEAIFIGLVLELLYLSKSSFYRRSLPFNWLGTLVNLLFAFVGVVVYVRLKHLILVDFLHKYKFSVFFREGTMKPYINGIIAYSALIVFLIAWQLTRPKVEKDKRFESFNEIRLNEFLESYNGHYLTHLLYLRDKQIFWAVSNQVAIVYQKSHNVMVALGDPIGDSKYFSEGISEFQEFMDEYGYKTAFYQVSEAFLPVYHDHGYNFFKLGETALIDLEEFDLSGSKNRDFRNVLSRFQRDGYVFELYPSLAEEQLESLKTISDEWLGGRKEMGFSLGRFDRSYLKHSPIAAVRKAETNETIAFASLMPSYDQNRSISIDLMRFKKEVPNNTMTYLILNLLITYKEQAYKSFNLGMAPLSNVGNRQKAHSTEKLANLFSSYGKHFYSFEGLRNYKSKFNPKWEARYLAYEDIAALPSSLIEATILIHSNKVRGKGSRHH